MSTFPQILHQIYQQEPDKPCVYLLRSNLPDEVITYRRLCQGAAGFARALADAGIQPGELVILILEHGPSLIYAFFGAILHGAVPAIMPFLTEKLDPEIYKQSLVALFQTSAPSAVVTYAEFEAEVEQATSRTSSVRAILVDESIQPDEGADFSILMGLKRSAQDLVLLQHSSGTTGLQKGVALSHQAVFNQLESYRAALNLQASDVIVSWLPLYHDMGLITGFILPILSRIPLILLSPFDWVRAPQRLMHAITHYRGSLCWLPNFAYNFCAQKVRDRDLQGVDLSSLRAVINCSEPMYYSSHQMFLERYAPYGLQASALATSYAMAENVFAVTQGGIDSPVNVDWIDQRASLTRQVALPVSPSENAIPMLSAGTPIQGTSVRIQDTRGQPLPERRIGEIALSSNCMLTGYYNRPDLTRKAFLDGWYLTGDLGYMADGEVYVTGRKKDLIIVGGKNVYPQDLERIAGEVQGVHPGRVVAFGVFNPQAGTEDVVLVAESDDIDPERQMRLAAEIRQRVTRGSDIALRHVRVVPREWLLKTSSGKIARAANREKYLHQIAPS